MAVPLDDADGEPFLDELSLDELLLYELSLDELSPDGLAEDSAFPLAEVLADPLPEPLAPARLSVR
jgi:hypothetical protein